MNNVERSIKIYGLIIGIILFIALMAGLSYAYYSGQTQNTSAVQGNVGLCFDIDYVKGGNVSGANLLLLDESNIINNNQVTITDGMVLTSLSAGINGTCTSTHATMDVYLKNITLNNAFISGNSAGALKYIIASYNKTSYPTATVGALSGISFNIVTSGTINSTSDKTLFTDNNLPNGSMNSYLVIFYLDGDMTFNDAANTSFSGTISAVANPKYS